MLCEFLDCDARDERVAGFAKLKNAEKMEKLVSDPATQKLFGLTPDQKAKLDRWGSVAVRGRSDTLRIFD